MKLVLATGLLNYITFNSLNYKLKFVPSNNSCKNLYNDLRMTTFTIECNVFKLNYC